MHENEKLKIIQIIPAPDDLFAVNEVEGEDDIVTKTVCLALVEDEDGDRRVMPMEAEGDDYIEFCENSGSFHSYTHSPKSQ